MTLIIVLSQWIFFDLIPVQNNLSEQKVLDIDLQQPIADIKLHRFPETLQKHDDEVQHTNRGAIAGPTVVVQAVKHVAPHREPAKTDAPVVTHGASITPLVPTPTAYEPELLVEPRNLYYPEPNLDADPVQLHGNSSQPGVPAHHIASTLNDEVIFDSPADS